MNKKKISFCNSSLSILFRSYSPFSEKGTLPKVKDFFVLDSYLINRWIGTYSGSKSRGVLLNHFYQLKAPIRITFL